MPLLKSAAATALSLLAMMTCVVVLAASSKARADEPMPLTALFWSHVSADWNGDGLSDAAVITAPGLQETDAALRIFLAVPEGGPARLEAERRDFLWGTPRLFGQQPELALGESGSLEVTTQNSAIGRGRWFQTLVLQRRQSWQVVGYRYEYYDTLAPGAQGLCYLNFEEATRQQTQGKKLSPLSAIKPQPLKGLRPVSLADWHHEIGLRACEIINE